MNSKTKNYIESIDDKINKIMNREHIKDFLHLKKKYKNNYSKIEDYLKNKLQNDAKELEGVERPRVLPVLFQKICNGNIEKFIIFCKRMQQNTPFNFHLKTKTYNFQDPLIFFETKFIKCGDIARFIIDLFQSVGYKGRLIQVNHHILPEIYYNNQYISIDVDMNKNENINLYNNVEKLTENKVNSEYIFPGNQIILKLITSQSEGESTELSGYPYYFYKINAEYIYIYKKNVKMNKKTRFGIIKNNNLLYNWNYFDFEINNNKISRKLFLNYFNKYNLDKINYKNFQNLKFTKITFLKKKLYLEWRTNNLIKYYSIYISTIPRGWNYSETILENDYKKYNNKYLSIDFSKIYEKPPHNLLHKTVVGNIFVKVIKYKKFYITIIPITNYGDKIKQKWYLPSEELIIF